MKITVFTSCYNQGEYLSQAIESVLNQSYANFEYFLIDDGSTDDTNEVMQRYRDQDARIRMITMDKQSNVGAVINRSIELMSGDIWVWLPADDIFEVDLLKTKIEESKKHNHSAVIYSWWRIIDSKGGLLQDVQVPILSDLDFTEKILTSCPLGCTGIWIPKKVLNLVGSFSEELMCSEDYDWILRATIMSGVKFVCIPQILYCKRVHENRTTNRMAEKIASVVKGIREEYSG